MSLKQFDINPPLVSQAKTSAKKVVHVKTIKGPLNRRLIDTLIEKV
jgi:hypothetical protein